MVARGTEETQGNERVGGGRRRRFNDALALVAVDRSGGKVDSRRFTKWLSRVADAFAGTMLAGALFATIWAIMPASLWFEMRSVQVFDTQTGVAPRMIVDRTIHRPFLGSWIVSVFMVTPDGLRRECVATGNSDYSPDARFPANLDLDWWTWPTQCNLVPGEYVVRTVWTIDVFGLGFLSKEARNISNAFIVS